MRDGLADAIAGALSVRRDRVRPEARLDALIRDSIDVIELVAALEERFGIEIDPSDLARIETVGDVDKYIGGHQREPRA